MIEIPDSKEGKKIAIRVTKFLMCFVSRGGFFRWTNAGILRFHRSRDDERIVEAAIALGLDKDATDARVHGPSCKLAARLRQSFCFINCGKLTKDIHAFSHRIGAGWVKPRQRFNVIDAEGLDVHDRRRQITAAYLRGRKRRPRQIIGLIKQTDGNTGPQATTTTRALVA